MLRKEQVEGIERKDIVDQLFGSVCNIFMVYAASCVIAFKTYWEPKQLQSLLAHEALTWASDPAF